MLVYICCGERGSSLEYYCRLGRKERVSALYPLWGFAVGVFVD